MTYNEMATIVAHFMGDPTSIPFREEAKRLINVWRSTLLRQSVDKNPLDRKFFQQTVYRNLVHSVLPACPDVPRPCIVLRTQYPVPVPLRANSILYDFIGNYDRNVSYSILDPQQVATYSYNKYISKRPYLLLQDGYLYLFGEQDLTCLMITGIFDSLSLDDCQHDLEYPCPLDIQQRILQVLEGEISKLPKIRDTEINITSDGKPTAPV